MLNLTFHGLGTPRRALDSGEEAVWLDTASYESILDEARTNAAVVITFDDGNLSDYEVGLPALAERNMDATFFVCAGRLNRPGFLSSQHLRDLVAAGMKVGSHGMAHHPWRGLSDADRAVEITHAKAILEDATGHPVTAAACPFGSYDRKVMKDLRVTGFLRVYTSDRGWSLRNGWLQARNTLHRGDGPQTIRKLLAGDSSFQRFARDVKMSLKRWR